MKVITLKIPPNNKTLKDSIKTKRLYAAMVIKCCEDIILTYLRQKDRHFAIYTAILVNPSFCLTIEVVIWHDNLFTKS